MLTFFLLVVGLIWLIGMVGSIYLTVNIALNNRTKIGDAAFVLVVSWLLVIAIALVPSQDSAFLEAFVLFLMGGSFAGITVVGRWVGSAPVIGLPALIVGFATSAAVFIFSYKFTKIDRLRRAILTCFAFGVSAWVVAEVLVSIEMKMKADALSNGKSYCLDRLSVPQMILASESNWFPYTPHAQLVTERAAYTWVFYSMSWESVIRPDPIDKESGLQFQQGLIADCRGRRAS
jgi:hypothetical protein